MSVTTQEQQLHYLLRKIHEKYRSDLQPIPFRNNAQQWISHLIALLFPVSSDKIFSKLDMNIRWSLISLFHPRTMEDLELTVSQPTGLYCNSRSKPLRFTLACV